MSHQFSLKTLLAQNRGLASHFLWGVNAMPGAERERPLHLGCGARVFDGFINLDITAQHPDVVRWDFLDLWPEDLRSSASGAFSEDCLEHFYLAEQTYILGNLNRALELGATARILMPSLERLVQTYQAHKGAIFRPPIQGGVETGADQLNQGLRYTGHRWLHDSSSLARAARLCGFDPKETECADPSVPLFSGLNLRTEADSASFAMDMRKVRNLSRRLIEPIDVIGAAHVEDLENGARLYRASNASPMARFSLTSKVRCDQIAFLNVRSSNLSSFDWNMTKLALDDGELLWHFDDTLKSKPCMNIVTQSGLRTLVSESTELSNFSFVAADRPGDYFALGCMELFVLE